MGNRQPQYNLLQIEPRKRRRNLRVPLTLIAGVIVVAAIVFTVHEVTNSNGSGNAAAAARTSGHRSAKASKSTGSTKRTIHKAVSRPVDPLTTNAAHTWIASRKGDVTAAVLDLKTGKEWLLKPSERAQTASIIKVDILETLLYQDKTVPSADSYTAEGMIEASNDDDATDLWNLIGGAAGIAAYNAKAGLTQTTPNAEGMWGETMTSAADQIKVLKQLVLKPQLLARSAQDYELGLMHNIDAGQNWGVTGGVPHGVSVALKNGWVPLTSYTDWEINSIGWVDGDDHDYLVAVLTKHDPSESYGITTIDKLSADIYTALDRKRSSIN